MIGLGMGFGPRLSVSTSLELRMNMECLLEQSLVIVQKQMMGLALYQKREDELVALYKKALARGDVRLYDKHGFKFEIALVLEKEVPAEILRECGPAFSHVLYSGFEALLLGHKKALSRGSWLLFAVIDYKNVPEKYLEYWAIHERGEQITLGNHNLATKLEFNIAAKEKTLRNYVKWLEENEPDHLANVFAYQMHLDLPDDDEFRELLTASLQSEEIQHLRNVIEETQWPYLVLQKLSLFDKINMRIDKEIRAINNFIQLALEKNNGLEVIVEIENSLIARFKEISTLRKYFSAIRHRAVWEYTIKVLENEMAERRSRIGLVYGVNPQKQGEFIDLLKKLALETHSLPKKNIFSVNVTEAFDYALSH